MVPAGAALAGYTALLFGQCEGRDLWQSRWLLPHTLVNALLAGAAALALLGEDLKPWIAGGAAASLAIIALDTFGSHPTRQAERAATQPVARHVRAPLLDRRGAPRARRPARARRRAGWPARSSLVGLWLYEDAWVRAGQSVPLS